jgi:hypothetical protein
MDTDRPFSPDSGARIREALEAVLEALKLALREEEGAHADPARRRWTSLGLVSALQAALVAALSGYDTAKEDAVQDPSHPERIAPVALLLRRARSHEFLNDPERLELSGSVQRALDRIIAMRNAAVHALRVETPETFAADALAAVHLIRHLVLEAPSFGNGAARLQVVLIGDVLNALQAVLSEGVRD